jgi:hypothetical protein
LRPRIPSSGCPPATRSVLPTVYPLMVVVGGKTMNLRDEFAKELGTQPIGPQIKFAYKTNINVSGTVTATPTE